MRNVTLTDTFGVAGSLASSTTPAPAAAPAWSLVSPWDDDREANRLDAAWERAEAIRGARQIWSSR